MSEVRDDRPRSVGVRCRGLSKAYRHRPVLSDMALSAEPGEVVAVTGASGSGKSTLLLILAGLLAPESGEITIDGTDIWGLGEDERTSFRLAHIGLVFQFGQLVGELTTLDNVRLPLLLSGRDRGSATATAHGLLEELGLEEVAGHYPHQLSGGQEQRTAIARALALDPVVVLADEPTGALDTAASRAVLGLLLEAARARDATVVIATHDDRIADSADRRLHLSDGRLVTGGRTR